MLGSAEKKEAVGTSETLIHMRQTSRRHIPEATIPLINIRKRYEINRSSQMTIKEQHCCRKKRSTE